MIVIFGSINVDLITPVPHLPARGETVIGGSYRIAPGGKGANQALAAALGAQAGQQVAMVGTIGPDAWGDVALRQLRDSGVNLSAVARGLSHTACGFISVDQNGQTLITVSPGANMETRAAQLDLLTQPFGKGDWLVLQMEVPLGENWHALKRAKESGARTLLNLAPALPLDEQVLTSLDILVVNEPEARTIGQQLAIASTEPADIARALASRFALTCIATLGENGAVACEKDGNMCRLHALKIDAIDTTGAGDAYVGYLVAALDSGATLPDAMLFAGTGASLTCERSGAQPSYLSRIAIEARLPHAPHAV